MQLDCLCLQGTEAVENIAGRQSRLLSFAHARFDVDPTQGKLTTGHVIAPHTSLFAPSQQGPICRFRTCYPVTLWPLVGMAAVLGGTMRAPLTGAVFGLELTNDVNALPALLLATVTAYGFTVLMAGVCTSLCKRRSFSRIFGAPQLGRSRLSRTISFSTCIGSRLACR